METPLIIALINGLTDIVFRIAYLTERLTEIADMDDEVVKEARARARMATEDLLAKLPK